MTRHVVEVATELVEDSPGFFWWEALRLSCAGSNRIRSPRGGAVGVCEVVCNDAVHALTLRQRMVHEGVPDGALAVREVKA